MVYNKNKIMRDSERYLKRTKAYQDYKWADENFELDYVLKKGTELDNVLAYASCIDTGILFFPYKKNNEYRYLHDWAFNFDNDLFAYLEHGYELAGMSLDCHYCVWISIEEWHSCDIEHKDGLQKYLDYCKKEHITKERLNKELSYDGMDVMELYNKNISLGNIQRSQGKDFER